MQLNLLVDMIIASFLSDGSISHLYYADRLVQLPLGVIGVAMGTALLPTLTRQLVSEETGAALASQNRAIEFSLLVTLPAAAAMMVIGTEIVGVLFERGAFDTAVTATVAGVLVAYALGLPAYVLIKVLSPAYFARQDPKTPLHAALVALVVNVVLNLIFMVPLGIIGIALASAIASWVNVVILAKGLMRRGYLRPDNVLRRRLPRMLLACFGMAIALLFASNALSPLFESSLGERVLALCCLIIIGLGSYGLVCVYIGAGRWQELKGAVGR